MIRLTTLGAARVHGGDTAYPDLPAQRLRFALLLYLAVEQDVSRDEVVTMFWPDRDTGRGRHALRQMLYELRQVLGEDWIDMGRDRITVRAAVDLVEFERAVEEGRGEDALALYGGPFLMGFSLDNRSFEAWTDRRSGHLARLHRRLRREHIAGLVAAGRGDDALSAARDWVELDPVDDEAAHTLIERLIAAGQRSAALSFYDAYARQIAAQLEVEPLEETRALIASVRNGDTNPQNGSLPQPAARATEQVSAALPDSAPQTSGPLSTSERPDTRLSPAPGSAPATPPGPALTNTSGRAGSGTTVRRPRWRQPRVVRRAAALALLLAAAPAAFFASTWQSAARDLRAPTVAILPFHDRSEDGKLEPWTGAIADALVDGLTKGGTISVISPNGARRMREQGASESELGRELNADYLIGGSVARFGDTARIYVDLTDTRTNLVQSETFERPWAESRHLADDAVRAAAKLLRERIATAIHVAQVEAGKLDEQAWRLLVNSKTEMASTVALLRAGELETAHAVLLRADSMLRDAARLDEQWAEPVLLRGRVLEHRAFVAGMSPTQGSRVRGVLLEAGLQYADEAEEREPGAPGARALRGSLLKQLAALQPDRDSVTALMSAAEAELRAAIAMDPADQPSASALAELLYTRERYGEAFRIAQQAFRLDPYSHEVRRLTHLLFNTTFEIGQDQSAQGWCSQGRGAFPNDLVFKYCVAVLHAWADGIEAQPAVLRKEIRTIEQSELQMQPHLQPRLEHMLAAAYARADQPDSARAILKRLEAADTGDAGALWMRAAAYARLGEDATALALMKKWFEIGDPSAARVARSRPFLHLRKRSNLDAMILAHTSGYIATTARRGSTSPTRN